MNETRVDVTQERLNYAARHTLFNMTSSGDCVPQQAVVNRAIRNYQLDESNREALRCAVELAALTPDIDGNLQYAVSEKEGTDGPFYRPSSMPLPDGHFGYLLPKKDEPAPVLPPAHNPLSITGYRHLSPAEIEQINRIKDAGAVLQALCAEVGDHISHQFNEAYQLKDDAGVDRLQEADPNRWFYEGRQKLQDGLMCLTRAIAQPSSF